MNENELATKGDLKPIVEMLSRLVANQVAGKTVEQKDWYKSAELKALLDCSDATIKNLRDSGKLIFTKIGGTYYYLHKDILELFEPQYTSYQLG